MLRLKAPDRVLGVVMPTPDGLCVGAWPVYSTAPERRIWGAPKRRSVSFRRLLNRRSVA